MYFTKKMNLMKRKVLIPLVALLASNVSVKADNWMSRLPDETFVAVVSIPGAHDAATGCGWADGNDGLGKAFAQTQDLDLGAQWAAGVRAFDLRPCKHKDGYLNINHGIVPTSKRFDEALYQLRDSLAANPTEFAILHVLHETDAYSGSQPEGNYNTMLLKILKQDDLKDYFVNFKRGMKVADVRGKIILLSRDSYTTGTPIGGIIEGWTHSVDWSRQTQGKIRGSSSIDATLYMQDYFDTSDDGGIDTKVEAVTKLLESSMALDASKYSRWVINFASGYSKKMLGFPTSDGYRDNATYTHAAILDHLATHEAGPMGIVMMDYAGVDKSDKYDVRGLELVRAIIDNNFKYLDDGADKVEEVKSTEGTVSYYSVAGMPLDGPQEGLNIKQEADGTVRKVLYR